LREARFLEPTLALLLHHGSSHGYTLLERLHEFGLGNLDTGAVYRTLRDMEQEGWVSSAWSTEQTQGPARRVYSLTKAGDQMLKACTQDLRQVRAQIDTLLHAYQRHMAKKEGKYHEN
jgi:poly-beta-hydroxybutyrate-responsive repressor